MIAYSWIPKNGLLGISKLSYISILEELVHLDFCGDYDVMEVLEYLLQRRG